MINLKAAGATQLTMKGGVLSDWKVSLDGEELYTLPSTVTVQQTFEIRRVIEKYMDYALEQGKLEMQKTKDSEIEGIIKAGNIQLDALIDENNRLATALENHMAKLPTY